jgi:hypothetical protein
MYRENYDRRKTNEGIAKRREGKKRGEKKCKT